MKQVPRHEGGEKWNMWFEKTPRLGGRLRFPVMALMMSIIALILVAPSVFSVHAFGPTCYNDNEYWNPEGTNTYAQTATTCNSGYMAVSSSANVQTLVPQSGTYTFTACKVPTGQLAFCTRSNTLFSKTVNTGTGVFPHDSTSYYKNGANTWYTTLDVTVLDTTTGNTNTVDSTSCTSNVGPCPL